MKISLTPNERRLIYDGRQPLELCRILRMCIWTRKEDIIPEKRKITAWYSTGVIDFEFTEHALMDLFWLWQINYKFPTRLAIRFSLVLRKSNFYSIRLTYADRQLLSTHISSKPIKLLRDLIVTGVPMSTTGVKGKWADKKGITYHFGYATAWSIVEMSPMLITTLIIGEPLAGKIIDFVTEVKRGT